MSQVLAEVDDRRRFGRVTPVERIRGTVGSVVVYVMDVSLAGARVAHQDPLPAIGERSILTFDWQGQRFSAPCEVRRTRIEREARSSYDKPLYHTGLLLMTMDVVSQRVLRELVHACVTRALDEQKANAQGIPAIAAQSFQTGKSDELLRCELRGGTWTKTPTRDAQQPPEGFTVSASELPSKIAMLCRAYEAADADGRRLIRTFAGLSISKTEGIPTRRYAP
ncbi:MAG TPA: PilZ domain-containing protein [Thermoanaerobaculia bacterium]|nr:PilZ domain-containing protein [Thermoanaerobaculia bacterium]